MARPIRWLHISDLHMGHRAWAEMEDKLHKWKRHVAENVKQRGMPDLILFTGDLTFCGSADNFGLVTRFLKDLKALLCEHAPGEAPLVLPVPGNQVIRRATVP